VSPTVSLIFFNVIGLVVAPFSLNSNAPSPPRLEFFSSGSNEVHRVTIEHSPFRIGRCETSDLRIDSAQVSREHAQIYQRGGLWSIRDLGSTNGTQVNGKLVRESFLSDGDILAIAETEMTFVAASVTPFQRMATQPIQLRASTKLPAILPSEISQMRALTEAMLWQAIPLQLATVVSLRSGHAVACFVHFTEHTKSTSEFMTGHAVCKRYRELTRLQAIEKAQLQSTANQIFLTADVADFDSSQELFYQLEQLRDETGHDFELGVSISMQEIPDITVLENVFWEVRNAKMLLGLVNFQGSSGQVLELGSCAPDYLVLSSKMLTGATANTQTLRRLELVLITCKQLGIKVVLPHCDCQRTISQCRQLGYEFALQTITSNEKVDRQNEVCLAS
jgi:hypothetical protein